MRLLRGLAVAVSALLIGSIAAIAATIGGTYYAPQYDFREFWAATDGRQFQVVLDGNPFPGIDPSIVARDLLPMMQSAKPRPALTFTYAEPSPPTRPNYRLVLIFDPANDLNADPVCAGAQIRHRLLQPGRFYVYAIYCRNDRMLSYTTAWTDASGPTDPRIERLFGELFRVIFSEQQNRFAMIDPMLR
jgi:hypothetical protein